MTVDTSLHGTAAVEALVEEGGSWPGVETGVEPRFGGPAFYIGRRQLGHLHDAGERGAFADLPLPRRVADELIEAGRARVHGAMPDSGWLTVPVRTAADLENAIGVFRLAHERVTSKRPPTIPTLEASPPPALPFAPPNPVPAPGGAPAAGAAVRAAQPHPRVRTAAPAWRPPPLQRARRPGARS